MGVVFDMMMKISFVSVGVRRNKCLFVMWRTTRKQEGCAGQAGYTFLAAS